LLATQVEAPRRNISRRTARGVASVDNIFVFVVIFSELHIREYQRRVLWRRGRPIVFRALAIGAGLTLIERVQWMDST